MTGALSQWRWAVSDGDAIRLLGDIAAEPDVSLPFLVGQIENGSPETRRAAVGALARFQQKARDAVPTLVKFMSPEDETLRLAVVEALLEIEGDVAIVLPTLVDEALHGEPAVQRAAIARLAGLGKSAGAAIPALENLLSEEDWSLRKAAIDALLAMGAKVDIVLPALLDQAQQETYLTRRVSKGDTVTDTSARQEAIDMLIGIGAASDVVHAALMEALNHASPYVRSWAIEHLGRFGNGAVPTLVSVMKNATDVVVERVNQYLDPTATPETTVVEVYEFIAIDEPADWSRIVAGYTAPRNEVACACRALAQIGPAAESAVPALIDELHSGIGEIELEAARALAGIGPEANEAVPVLLEEAQSESDPTHWLCAK
jgi:HEAT repeat protein